VSSVAEKEFDYDQLTNIINQVNEGKENKDRRQKKDWVSRMATILSLSAWAVMIAVWVLIEYASPETEFLFLSGFGRVHFDLNPVLRQRWNDTLIYIAYVLLLVSLGTCLIAFFFNKIRMKRKTDKYKKSIFVIGGITVIAFIFFLIVHGSRLF